jgi:phosphomannomutase
MTATTTIDRDDRGDEEEVPSSFWPAETRWSSLREKLTNPQGITTFLVVLACVVFTFHELSPSLLFRNTTPAGGDMGAHVWLPDFVKRALLPHLRLTGWAPDWYEGFPALTYYFPGPIVGIAFLSFIIPYNIAFKLVTVLGLVTLPIAAYAFGRLARLRFPGPACLAVATVPYLFFNYMDNIYGGNIAATMAGEFSFSIGLSLAVVFLGVVIRGLDTGRHRALAAVLLAGVGICHILTLFFAIGGALVITALHADRSNMRDWRRRVLQWTLPVLAIGGALIAVWALPFYYRLPYATDMGYQKITTYMSSLFPQKDLWLFLLAGSGLILSVVRRNRLGLYLGVMTVLAAVVFRYAPQARIWNARVLPFWYLCLFLLVGIAFLEVGTMIVEALRQNDIRHVLLIPVPVVTLLVALVWVNFPLHNLPFGHQTASGKYDWLGITSNDSSFIPSWVNWNYSGYQSPGKAREQEYFAVVNKMKQLGADPAFGCGRAMWEYEPEFDQMGTPDALMLLPYWTKGCIGSEEGLYYESSASTPYHFLNAAELSDSPSNPVRGLNYPSGPNVREGIQHLQMLGVKYFMAVTPDIEAQADADNQLRLVATVGPYPVTYTSGSKSSTDQRTWKIYEVANTATVSPLIYQPVVMKGVGSSGKAWLAASQAWYLDPNRWNVYEAASGPKSWARVSATATNLPRTPLPPVQVSNIRQDNESISFDVDQTGVPVLVKTSYFPNWQATGAGTVYRVTPNMMVVIPTSRHVTLSYGYTPIDWFGFILTLLALVGVVVMWRLRPVEFGPSRHFALAGDGRPGGPDPEDGFGGGDGADDMGVSAAAAGADLSDLAGVHGGMAGSPEDWAPSGGFFPAAKVPAQMTVLDPDALAAIFKAYDIRGIVPDQMNTELARAVGSAFARFAGAGRLLVGRDMRPSGVELTHAFAEGATAAGVDVVDLGLTSTDELYFASGHLNAPGAMFTASHNPAAYNGIKLCLAGARPVGIDTGLREIRSAVVAIGREGDQPAAVPGRVVKDDVLADYAAKVRSFVEVDALAPLRVVADTANGMGGLVVPAVFDGLPFDLEILFGELDGTFPNHPADPIQPANLVDLQRRIRETNADVGLAFDGDADRCFLVDDLGVPVSGSTTTALVAAAMLDKHPGATILHNLICSKAVPEIIRERGGVPVRTRVGHSYIKAIMADTDALFGGEHSGHYYFRDNYRADSGCIAALVVLEVLSRSGRRLSDLRTDFERYADSGEINTTVADPAAVIEAIAARYEGARQDRLDGLTVDLGSWWFNVRPSNTEPLLRLNVEAADAGACADHTAEVLSVIRDNEDNEEEAET